MLIFLVLYFQVKLLTFLHDLNCPVSPTNLPPESEGGMIPLNVLQPAMTSQAERERTGIHTVKLHTKNTCVSNKSLTSRKLKFDREVTSHKPSSLPHVRRQSKKSRYRNLHGCPDLTLNLASSSVYHTTHHTTTLRYSPAKLTSMLQHHNKPSPTSRQKTDIMPDMMLHVNDYTYDRTQKKGNACDNTVDTLKISRDFDSYEESSGYSSSHVYIRSCQNVAELTNGGEEDHGVWEHHNSC